MSELNEQFLPIVTFDVDWSPDWIVKEVGDLLLESGVKSTWFVTHPSGIWNSLRSFPKLFELGIHPNCLQGSTHGATEEDALSYTKAIVPDAVSMRTHGPYQTTRLLMAASQRHGIRFDSSIYIPGEDSPVSFTHTFGNNALTRVPIYWDDYSQLCDGKPLWDFKDLPNAKKSPRVFSFHPFHIILNTCDINVYERLKSEIPLPEWTPEHLLPYRNEGKGAKTMFIEILRYLKDKESKFVCEIGGTRLAA